MKTLLKVVLVLVIIALFTSCQSSKDAKQILSNTDTKKGIMECIANDNTMSKEMMETMMNSENCKMMMKENEKMTMMMMEDNGTMKKMMQDHPDMMQSMMSQMMETCKKDTSMMNLMCKTMMGNHEMMETMHNMKGKK